MSDNGPRSPKPTPQEVAAQLKALELPHRIAVERVANLERALAFYCDGLNYDIIEGRPAAVIVDGGTRARKALPGWEKP